MIDASLVAQRFAQAGQSYSAQAVIQKKISQQLIAYMQQYLPSKTWVRNLEVGCGSGNLSHQFMQHFQYERLYLNDLYADVQQHFSPSSKLEWLIGDIQQLDFPSQLDLVMSSSALQWMTDLDQVFTQVYQALQPQGYFCFSSFGINNLKEIKQLTGRGLSYLSVDVLHEKLEAGGFELLLLQDQIEPLYFDHPKQVLQHLKATGVTATAQQYRWSKQSLCDFYQQYTQFSRLNAQAQPQYPLSYHPIYCIARRTS